MSINSKNVLYNLDPKYGSVQTTVYNKLKNLVSVRDFGAKGNSLSDDTKAFKNAIKYLENRNVEIPRTPESPEYYTKGDGALYIPVGSYVISEDIITKKAITYFGDGPEISEIHLYNNSSIIHRSSETGTNESSNQFTMKDLRISVAEDLEKAALDLNFVAGATVCDVNLYNVKIIGLFPGRKIKQALKLNNARLCRIDQCMFVGDSTKNSENQIINPPRSENGLIILGSGQPCLNPVDLYINNCYFQHWRKSSVFVAGCVEGVNFDNVAIVDSKIGMFFDASLAGNQNAEPWFKVQGCHLNCSKFGIYTKNIMQFNFGNNLFYSQNFGSNIENSFSAISINNNLPRNIRYNLNGNIHHNFIGLIPSTNQAKINRGIVINGGPANETTIIDSCQYSSLDVGIFFGNQSNGNLVSSSQIFNNCKTNIQNKGLNNKILYK